VPAARAVLAALFVGWVLQAVVLQRRFHYVHVPETLLLFAVFAARRWPVVPAGLAYLAATSLFVTLYQNAEAVRGPVDRVAAAWPRIDRSGLPEFWDLAVRHPAVRPARAARWADCWAADLPADRYYDRQDAVALLYYDFPSVTAGEIHQASEALRRLGAADGDVLCWHDSPHAVYLHLGHRPRFRFMHVTTALMGGPADPASPFYRMRAELTAALGRSRFVVSDLRRAFQFAPDPLFGRYHETAADGLPPALGPWNRGTFPYDQPAVFRTTARDGRPGRYVVHRLAHPLRLTEYDVEACGWAGAE
jgi:hypothetical protein